MKRELLDRRCATGFTLMETVVSLGVLALALPVVLAGFGQAGRSEFSSTSDWRAAAVVPICLAELQAARVGRGAWLDAEAAKALSNHNSKDEVVALACGRDGAILGRIGAEDYRKGLKEWNGHELRALVRLSVQPAASSPQVLIVRVEVETPAAAPAEHRQCTSFTCLLR